MDGQAILLLESYGARLARQGLAESTRTKYLAAVDRFLRSLGDADPATVTRQDVDEYLDRWHAAEQPAANSVRLHLSALKSFYSYLDDRGLLEGRNPVERIKARASAAGRTTASARRKTTRSRKPAPPSRRRCLSGCSAGQVCGSARP